MKDLEKIFKDITELEKPITRVPGFSKAQMYGNDFINIYFLRSGYSKSDIERYYYVIIENGDNPIPPTLMTPAEIKEKLNLGIDDYY